MRGGAGRATVGFVERRDWLPALGLGIAAQLEVWIWWVEAEQGPRTLASVALALMAAALLWRRRAPLPALMAMCVIYAAWVLVDPPAGSLMPFVILLAGVFAAAQRETPRRAVAGGVAGLAAVWLEIAVTDNDFANYMFTGVFVAGAWLAGRGFRIRDERADVLSRAAIAEERARIARELHDVVAHNVSVMVIQSQAAQQSTEPDSEAGRALRSIESTGREALTEMRRLLGLLRREDEEVALAPAAQPAAPRPPHGERARGGPAGRGGDRGRAGLAAAGRRPLRLPHRAGGADQRAQARRRGPRAGRGQLRRRRAGAADQRRRRRRGGGRRGRPRADRHARARERLRRRGREREPARRRLRRSGPGCR